MNTDRKILREIVTISRCVTTIRNEEFKEFSLTRGQHAFLIRIMENPGISQEDLSYMLRTDKTTTAKALKKLEEKIYIRKEKSESDKRSWGIYPTDKLVEIYPFLVEKIESTAMNSLNMLNEEEKEIFLKNLQLVRSNIDAEWINVKK